MTGRSIIGVSAAILAAAGAARSASATFFSFASDMNSNAYTFEGSAGSGGAFTLGDFSRPNTFMLLIDDNNGPLPSLSIPIEFHANLTANGATTTLIGGSLYQHSYRISGQFGFYSATGTPLMTVDISSNAPGFLTVPGSQNSWSSSGAVLGSDTFSDVSYTATQALVNAMGGAAIAAQYGITLGAGGSVVSTGPDDFGFDLTAMNGGAIGLSVALDATTHLPTSTFRAESSFSGNAALGGIPTPGSICLLGAGGFLAAMRRRTAR